MTMQTEGSSLFCRSSVILKFFQTAVVSDASFHIDIQTTAVNWAAPENCHMQSLEYIKTHTKM